MAKQVLTDRMLKALKPAPTGQRRDYMDAVVPGLGMRVTDKADGNGKAAQRTFIFIARFPGSPNPTRRALGAYGELTLEAAREKARHWHELIGRGLDPADEERRAVEAETTKRDRKFGPIMEEFIGRHLKGKRKAADVEREIRRELLPAWKNKPITDITRRDVVKLVEAIADRPAMYQAHNCFGHIRTFFNWVIDRGIYGLELSPCDRLKPARLIGPKKPRQRVLNDDEIFAYLRAADRLGYPFGGMFRLLILTGQRKSEVSDAHWREFDLEKRIWTVPPERFKSDASHLVPLTDDALALLRSLPRFTQGDCLFTTTYGEKPVSGFSKAKARLDRRMLRTLQALAKRRDEQITEIKLAPFVIHDVRRTVRTRLSSLRVPANVAEMVIGHGKKGLARVYDQHEFLDEMQEALELWTRRLREILNPVPTNVIAMRERVRR
jgi:integrase